MVATDREALRADTALYEHAERCIQHWGFEKRRRRTQLRALSAASYRPRSTGNTERAAEVVDVFMRKQRLTRKQQLKQFKIQEHERARRRNERLAELRARRGSGPVRVCPECQRTIYRGDGDTCGCKPCVHCGGRFRGDGRKCQPCKNNPELITARGRQTRSSVGARDGQGVGISPMSPESMRVDGIIGALEPWMRDPLELRYFDELTDHKAAAALMIPVPVFAGRARAAVARVAEALANVESLRIVGAQDIRTD